MPKIVVELAPEMKKEISRIAKRDGAITDSEIVRRLLKDGIKLEREKHG